MLAEFVNTLRGMARNEQGIESKSIPELRKVIVRQGDNYEEHDLPPIQRDGLLLGFEDFIMAALDDGIVSNAEVYHCHDDGLTLLCDREDRWEQMRMPLDVSKRFRTACKLAATDAPMSAWEAIRLLRFDMPSNGSSGLIPKLRKLNFTRRNDGSRSIEHGRESMGRQVEMAVQQADDIPESFIVEIPVYQNAGLIGMTTVSIEFGILIDVEREAIRIKPLADQLQMAVTAAQVAIGEALRSRLDKVPVYYGAPSSESDDGKVGKVSNDTLSVDFDV